MMWGGESKRIAGRKEAEEQNGRMHTDAEDCQAL